MAATIKDIAQKAGVSNAMVSRALSGQGPVAPAKKERILRIAREMGYVPPRMAIAVSPSGIRTIGLCVSSISRSSSPYVLHQILVGVYDVLPPCCRLLIQNLDRLKPEAVCSSPCDGYLILSQQERDLDFFQLAIKKRIPMVAISHRLPLDVPCVTTDEAGGIAKAMELLLDYGHRRIGIIEGPQGEETTLIRHAGWWTAAKTRGLSPRQLPVESGNYRYRSGKSAALRLLQKHRELTALLCFNDEMALGALDAARELGLAVPDQLSLTGYDNWDFAGHSDAYLTTVERNTVQLGAEGTHLLMEYMETGIRPRDLCLENRLVVRRSAGPVRRS